MPSPLGAPPEDLAIRGVIGQLADVAITRKGGEATTGMGGVGAVLDLIMEGRA